MTALLALRLLALGRSVAGEPSQEQKKPIADVRDKLGTQPAGDGSRA